MRGASVWTCRGAVAGGPASSRGARLAERRRTGPAHSRRRRRSLDDLRLALSIRRNEVGPAGVFGSLRRKAGSNLRDPCRIARPSICSGDLVCPRVVLVCARSERTTALDKGARPRKRESSAQGPVKRRGQEAPSPEITWAEILGVDDTGSVRISGWLQGCVDLAPRPASFVECATLERAGKNVAPDADAFPQLFFTSSFDDTGGWKGSRAFPRLKVRDISWSSAGDSLAATASGWWTRPLAFQAPAGTPSSISFGEGDPPYKSIVALFDRTGRLRGALHLLAHEAQVVRSLTFDEHGWLWMLATYSPGLEVRGPGRVRTGASVGNCLSLLSLADVKSGKRDQATYFHASYCTPSRSASFPSTLSAGPDDRVIVSWAPAGMFEGEPFEPPPGLASPPSPRDIYGNVSRDYVPTRLVVTRRGRLEWSSPIPASHAIGLSGGWVCFEVPTKLACVRPTISTSTPSSATGDPGKLPGSVDRRPRQDH